MNVIINGESKSLSPHLNLHNVIRQYDLPSGSFVIELNGEIIPPENYAEKELKDGDQVEIIRFVGGG